MAFPRWRVVGPNLVLHQQGGRGTAEVQIDRLRDPETRDAELARIADKRWITTDDLESLRRIAVGAP